MGRETVGYMRCRKQMFAVMAVAAALGCAVPALAQGAIDRIKSSGVVRACIWPDYHSITFRNPKNGQLSGIDIVLSRKFAEMIGARVEHIDSSFATLIADLTGGKCDVGMFGIAATTERKEKLAFSSAYLRGDILGATTKNNPRIKAWADIDVPGRIVAVQAGTYMEPVMARTLKNAQLLVVRPPATREKEVQSGRADVFMTDFPYTRRLLENEDWITIISPPEPFFPIDYAYATARGEAALIELLNTFVAQIRSDGTLKAAAEQFGLGPILVR